MGDSIRVTVRKAAKFAVYDDMIMSVKNHQTPPTIRPDIALGRKIIHVQTVSEKNIQWDFHPQEKIEV